MERFVLFWGEMASNWGINRTMAQIHALLYACEGPLDTDEIMERLRISRGNANMNLHALMNWNLVRKVHQPGSRKDYYTAEKDVWQITAQIIKERERREIKPVKQQLRECRDILTGGEADRSCAELDALEGQLCLRIDNLVRLMEVFEGFSRALLPFLEERNAPMIKQFIRFAEEFHGASSPRE
ncbi:GbsR/MarR family transcriptional regulator [Rhodocaloribacter sp.]